MINLSQETAQPTSTFSRATRCTRTLSRIALSIIACVLFASCAALQPAFRAPVAPFVQPPATTTAIAEHLTTYQPLVTSLDATLQVAASGGKLKGKEKFSLQMRYRAPDNIMVGVNGGGMVGRVLIVTQKADEVAIHLTKEGQFYRGALAELDAYPRVLYGIRPGDLARALLVSQETANQLRTLPAGRQLQMSPDHWFLSISAPGRAETYFIRREDGLVDEVRLYDASSALKVRIVYSRYAMFHGVLLPSRFDLFLPNTGMQLTVNLDKAAPNIDIPEGRFSLTPPGQLDSRPLGEWLERLDREANIEARKQSGTQQP